MWPDRSERAPITTSDRIAADTRARLGAGSL
jgi:hypothetical protein